MASVLAHDTAGPIATYVYNQVAEILICGIDRCDEMGNPLTQVQQVQLAATALGVVDGTEAEIAGMLTCDADIRTLDGAL